MYLTRFQINPGRRNGKALLNSPRAIHAAVMATSPDGHTTPEGRVLWRVDKVDHNHYLYILSPFVPDLTGLVEEAGWPSRSDQNLTRLYDPIVDGVRDGQTWRFRATLNPVKSLNATNRRVPIKDPAEQLAWFDHMATRHGFAIDTGSVAITYNNGDRFNHDEDTVTLRRVTFEGSLTVTETTMFQTALTHGIGRGRAYGCGLLTLAPPQ